MNQVRTSPSIPHTEYFPSPRSANGPGRWLAIVRNDALELARFWPVVQNMVAQELRIRYHRSVLGFLWTLLNPILMMATLRRSSRRSSTSRTGRNTRSSSSPARSPGRCSLGSLSECSSCIVANEGLIRKIYLPKLIFPLSRVLINLTTFVLSLAALYLVVGLLGAKITPAMAFLPVVIAALRGLHAGAWAWSWRWRTRSTAIPAT